MINGLEGIPGSGKSYEAVVYHVLAALQSGRKVITNLPLVLEQWAAIDPGYLALIEIRKVAMPARGVWDSGAAGRDEPAYKLWTQQERELAEQTGEAQRPAADFPFGGVWCFYSEWRDAKGRGPLYVIDECHIPLPDIGTNAQVVEWFKIHRHFNSDVLLMTQSFRDINQKIARLIGMLIKCRKADILGKADHYIRKVHGGYRGAVISQEERPYKPQYFPLYKSHTQGVSAAEAKAQDVAPLYVKVQRAKWAVLGVAAVACVYAFWPKADAKAKPRSVEREAWFQEAKKRAGKPLDAASAVVSQAKQEAAPEQLATKLQVAGPGAMPVSQERAPADAPLPEPYGTKGLHMVGRLSFPGRPVLYMVTVSQNGAAIQQISSADLVRVGYRFDALDDCVARVQWGNQVRVITCDAPSLTIGQQPRSAGTSATVTN